MIHGVSQDSSVLDAASEFIDKQISALAVYQGDDFVGIFTKNDLVRCCVDRPEGLAGIALSEVMKTDLYTTTPDSDVDDVMEQMVRRGFRHVPVLENGRAVGMITAQDILSHQNEILEVERKELRRYIQGSY